MQSDRVENTDLVVGDAGERLSWVGRLAEVFGAFGKLGLISFGGPIAHLGYFRTEFVQKRHWISDAEFADLVALCQFLPGPASSQVVFALGMRRAGVIGALVASLCFMLPSAAMMIAFAYGVAHVGDLSHARWLHGLKLAAVVVVAQAVWGMGKNLCPDRARLSTCLAAAAILLAWPGAIVQLGIIAGGAMVGWMLYRRDLGATVPTLQDNGVWRTHLVAAGALLVFFALLIALPAVAAATGSETWKIFDGFYRSGSLVFGGGHVVLPLLRAEVVPRGWVTDDQFLAGYGAAQAVPGPLFTFSAYLGAAMHRSGIAPWVNGLWCLLAIFLPAWLLIGGALPFWHRLRRTAWAQAGLRGANAAVVGVLLAAWYSPVFLEGVKSARDVAAGVVAFGLLVFWRVPVLGIVGGLALTGWLGW
ncbi:MAG TPA: chromate efflux transporter [Phycisphaerae bacterium]|nr:chromate efflux transporter [Phycisphaerae bacterium]